MHLSSKKDKTKKKRINTKSRNFKRKKENCLEVSSKSDQTISVSSSSEPKQQKRGKFSMYDNFITF